MVDSLAEKIEFNTPGTSQYNATWLNFFPEIKEALLYLGDIVNQTLLEFTNFLNKKYPNIEFLTDCFPQDAKLDIKLPLSRVLYHCYPILYGLQQNSENNYQRILQAFLMTKQSNTALHEYQKITAATLTFQSLANSKKLPPLKSNNGIPLPAYNKNSQTTQTVKKHIQHSCLELINTLEQCKKLLCTTPKENHYISGIIYRLHGFSHFIQKKLGIDLQDGSY